jgi:hypothetical protein
MPQEILYPHQSIIQWITSPYGFMVIGTVIVLVSTSAPYILYPVRVMPPDATWCAQQSTVDIEEYSKRVVMTWGMILSGIVVISVGIVDLVYPEIA